MAGTTIPDYKTHELILAHNTSNDGPNLEAITPFNFEGESTRVKDGAVKEKHSNIINELMKWHIGLNQSPFSKMKLMAHIGRIPKNLANIKLGEILKSASYIYGRATLKSCQGTKQARPIEEAKLPAEYVSTDSFELRTKGFIAQIKGNLMKDKYTSATYLLTVTQTCILYTCKQINLAMNS